MWYVVWGVMREFDVGDVVLLLAVDGIFSVAFRLLYLSAAAYVPEI